MAGICEPPAPSPWLQAKEEVAAERSWWRSMQRSWWRGRRPVVLDLIRVHRERAPRLEFMGNELEFGNGSKAFVIATSVFTLLSSLSREVEAGVRAGNG
nr:unnamed protein product [Digitaria exilis]